MDMPAGDLTAQPVQPTTTGLEARPTAETTEAQRTAAETTEAQRTAAERGPQRIPASLIWGSPTTAYARFGPDGTCLSANPRFETLVGGRAVDRLLPDLVVDGQRDEAGRLLHEGGLSGAHHNLHFASGDQVPTTLVVTWAWVDGDLVLVGEPPIADLEASQTAIVKLNSRVSDLARENAKKSAELAKALADLREAEAMLVHREKLAALGRVTAGVAHELNNPLAYIKNNQFLLRRDIADLLGLLNLFGESLEVLEGAHPELFEALMDRVQEIDLPRVAANIPRLLDVQEEGVDRAAELVRGLRTFSRLDEAEVKSVDLNGSLRSVVEFAGFLLNERGTELVTEYGSLPAVTCRPSHVNQAVLNVLTNAIQAAGDGGRVTLTTKAVEAGVMVTISDNGPGVPEGLREHIFEPFFTTRPVGEGVGLGLSIAHTVLREHGGTIDLESTPGGGATFVIRLPVKGGNTG